MSESKSSLLNKRIEQFFESSTELLTDIHARNKAGTKGTSTKKRKAKKAASKPNKNTDLLNKKPSGK